MKYFHIRSFLVGLFFISHFISCGSRENRKLHVIRDVWKMEQAQISSFDPLDAYHSYHIQLTKQLFNTLTDLDNNGEIIPSLAESWKTEDGRNWLFTLRDSVWFVDDSCFSDKSERSFKAEDVHYTFERLLSLGTNSLGASYFLNIKGATKFVNGLSDSIEGIKVLNDYSISFTLEKSDYNFPSLMSLPYASIVKKKAINSTDCKKHPIGTGPFILDEYLPNQSITLLKNPEYWERRNGKSSNKISKVEILLSYDDNYSFLLFKNQKADFLELNLPMTKQLESTKMEFKYKKHIIESAQLNFYLFNLDRIKDSKIRKGINYAINRKKLQSLLGENGRVTKSLYPKQFKSICQTNKILESNKNKAEKYLNQTMSLKLVAFDDILSRSIANQILADLKLFDIAIEIEAVPFSVLVDRLVSGNYDMIQLYWGMLYMDVNHFLTPFRLSSFPPAGNNFNRYSNNQFDSLINIASQVPENQQVDLYKQAENIILDDMPFLLTYYKNVTILEGERYTLPMNSLLYKIYKDSEYIK